MLKLKWLPIALLVLGLAACASGPETMPGAATGGMANNNGASRYGVDQNGSLNTQQQYEQGNEAETYANPLENPDSPLSQRRIYFAFDSAVIKPKYKPILNAHAKYLLNHPNAHVRLEGNTDERGTREYNIALGQRRAESVARYLKLRGVSGEQISTLSYGEEMPLKIGHNPQAWAKNRRVHIVYTYTGLGK